MDRKLKTEKKILKQEGNKERGRERVKQEDGGGKNKKEVVGGHNRGAGREAKIGGNKEGERAKQTETDGWSKEREQRRRDDC